MRNLLFISILSIAAMCASCGGKCASTTACDSTADTAVADTVADSTVVVDTLSADSVA